MITCVPRQRRKELSTSIGSRILHGDELADLRYPVPTTYQRRPKGAPVTPIRISEISRGVTEQLETTTTSRRGFLGGAATAAQGSSIEVPTTETVNKAVDAVREQKGRGQIRQFTGNDYASDLAAGEYGRGAAIFG